MKKQPPPTKALTGQDPMGRQVVLLDKTWTTHIEKVRGESLPGGPEQVLQAMTDPDRIVRNQRGPTTGDRVADERCERYDAALGGHVVVPTMAVEEEMLTESGTVAKGARKAVTAYVSSDPKPSKVLWLRKKNHA
jgi:hypothetical protein